MLYRTDKVLVLVLCFFYGAVIGYGLSTGGFVGIFCALITFFLYSLTLTQTAEHTGWMRGVEISQIWFKKVVNEVTTND